MVDTEIFEYESANNYECFDEVLSDINNLIREKEIAKEDIIEYRTENWKTEEDGNSFYHLRTIISWWK